MTNREIREICEKNMTKPIVDDTTLAPISIPSNYAEYTKNRLTLPFRVFRGFSASFLFRGW